MSCPSFSPTLTAFAALQLEKDPPHLTTVELAPEALKRDRANERRTGVTLDLLVLTLALELPLQALNKSHHVGLALSKEEEEEEEEEGPAPLVEVGETMVVVEVTCVVFWWSRMREESRWRWATEGRRKGREGETAGGSGASLGREGRV
jgi:hypothetical protein